MKKIELKIKPEAVLGLAIGGLSLVQAILTNKKEAADKNTMKEEIVKEVLDKVSKSE